MNRHGRCGRRAAVSGKCTIAWMTAATQSRRARHAADHAFAGWRRTPAGRIVAGMIDVDTQLAVRDAGGAELVAGCALLARALGFADRDAVAPWLVQTAAACGGLALGAFADARLVGFSFALPAAGGELFSCGLAVEPAWRGRGVGRALKLAQRERALELGCTRIRWTADPLSAPALGLYLSGLGARLIAYEPELYAAVRPAAADDVVIDWPLAGAVAARGSVSRVEIPLDLRSLDGAGLRRWRLRVRNEMTRVLDSGAVGTGVHAAGGRAWVVFSL
jgi:GNAT superfamily N-acetyltransferase